MTVAGILLAVVLVAILGSAVVWWWRGKDLPDRMPDRCPTCGRTLGGLDSPPGPSPPIRSAGSDHGSANVDG